MAERYKFPVGNTVGVASNIFRTPEQIKASEDKIKAALKYLLQGMSKAEAQRQVIEDFKLDRKDGGTASWMKKAVEQLPKGFEIKSGYTKIPGNEGTKEKDARRRNKVVDVSSENLERRVIRPFKKEVGDAVGKPLGQLYEGSHMGSMVQAKRLGIKYPVDAFAIQPEFRNNKVAKAIEADLQPLYDEQFKLFKKTKKFKGSIPKDLQKQISDVNFFINETTAGNPDFLNKAKQYASEIKDTITPVYLDEKTGKGRFAAVLDPIASNSLGFNLDPNLTMQQANKSPEAITQIKLNTMSQLIGQLKPDSKEFKKICGLTLAKGGTVESCIERVNQDPVGNAEKFANQIDSTKGPLSKIKNAANTFLNVAKKGGRFGAFAAAGAAAAGLVKEFRNDDPSTYLSNENQQKNMLIDMITQPVSAPLEQPSTAFGDAQLPAIGAVTAAGMIPGGAELYKQRTGAGGRKRPLGGPRLDEEGAKILQKRVSPFRAALGPMSGVLGKGLAATGTPLGMLALEPLFIGQQIADGDSAGEIATNPMNYLGPAFAGSLSKEATRFAGPKMANFMRLGISPTALKTVSRRFGLPGLGISAGISGYEMYQNKKAGRGLFDDG